MISDLNQILKEIEMEYEDTNKMEQRRRVWIKKIGMFGLTFKIDNIEFFPQNRFCQQTFSDSLLAYNHQPRGSNSSMKPIIKELKYIAILKNWRRKKLTLSLKHKLSENLQQKKLKLAKANVDRFVR